MILDIYVQYLLCNTIRDGDAHLKNFGLLYGPGSAPTLAPVYDMLSMSTYAPKNDQGDAMDTLALTFGGTKRWLKAAELKRLGTVCGVSPAHQARYKECMTQALLDTAQEVTAFQRENPRADRLALQQAHWDAHTCLWLTSKQLHAICADLGCRAFHWSNAGLLRQSRRSFGVILCLNAPTDLVTNVVAMR